jgi:poly-gamma-glutamate capsule biosynthesis protein CapA/YwtB (metallophosphatase superfamily)
MTIKTILSAASIAVLLSAGSAFAQSAEPAAQPSKQAAVAVKKAKPVKAAKAPAKPRSAASLECSKHADEKKLKGKERRKFRSACLKAAKKAAKKADTIIVPPLPVKKS